MILELLINIVFFAFCFVVIMKKLFLLLLLAGMVIPAAATVDGPELLLPAPAHWDQQ